MANYALKTKLAITCSFFDKLVMEHYYYTNNLSQKMTGVIPIEILQNSV